MDEATTEEQLEQTATLDSADETSTEETDSTRIESSWLASAEQTEADTSSEPPETEANASDLASADATTVEAPAVESDEAVNPDAGEADENDVAADTAIARTNSDVFSEQKGGRGRRVVTILAAVLGLGVLLALAGAAYATYDFKNEYKDKILPGATVAGVDVGGMTEGEARRAVKAAIRPKLQRSITVSFGGREWKVTPEELGARSNARAAVASAMAVGEDTSWTELAQMRFFDEELDIEEDVSIRYSKKGARSFVAGLEKEVNRKARDAELDYSSGWVEIKKEREGHELLVPQSTKKLMAALTGGRAKAELEASSIKPEITADSFDQVILVRQSDFKVYLYTDGKISHEWPIAIGMAEYPTPIGEFSVELKRYMPTWINPAPDGWGADMPAMIPPGPGNPLGVRAINWTAPGIRFHGTSAVSSIGTRASHGCVRLYNEDVIELYDLVEEGSPIISVW